jgi:NAD(P)-dependent dehydrogenase (short-subunit alcohol dehydrogenase family)
MTINSEFNGKVALITGANKGIGLEMSRQLGEQGFTVLMAARNLKNAEDAAADLKAQGLEVQAINLDVTDSAQIESIAKEIGNKFDKLDVLINNAGVMLDGEWVGNETSSTSASLLHKTFDTNFFGLVELTQALLPLILKSPSGRIVNMSSIMASLTLHADSNSPIYYTKPFAYDASKAAVNSFTIHLAQELKDTSVKVNSAHPGWVKTALGGEQAPMDVVEGAKTGVRLATLTKDAPTGGFFHFGETLPW